MRLGLAGVALSATLLWGQPAPLAFEVATIKPSAPSSGRMMLGMQFDAGRVTLTNMSLKGLLAQAYDIKEYQVSGPEWMDSQHFDIVAKLPEGAPREKAREMLQTLLSERFNMKLHRESKELSAYALTVGKGGFKAKAGDPEMPPGLMFNQGKLNGRSVEMSFLCGFLARFAGRPVVDMTGIKGHYDFVLHWMPPPPAVAGAMGRGGPPQEGAGYGSENSEVSVFTAVQEIGLKLEARKAPVDTLVIDHLEKRPIEN